MMAIRGTEPSGAAFLLKSNGLCQVTLLLVSSGQSRAGKRHWAHSLLSAAALFVGGEGE